MHRLEDRGGRLHLGVAAEEIVVRRGRAVAVRTGDGAEVGARRAVLASIDAPQLLGGLVGEAHLPPRTRDGLRRFQYDLATFKVDWALDGPIPWTAEPARRAGTLHLGDSLEELTVHTSQVTRQLLPDNPYAVVGQMNLADPSRSPAGTHTVWAYTTLSQRIQARVEALAPGFTDRIIGRHILKPQDMQARNRSLVGGQRNGGTSQLYQQLVFRPTPGLGRPETPVRRLYLASASAHPGSGMHGGPGRQRGPRRASCPPSPSDRRRGGHGGRRLGSAAPTLTRGPMPD